MIAGARNGNLQLLTFARFPEPEFLVDEEQHFGRLSGGVRRLIYLRRCSWDTHHEEKYDCDEERFSFHAMKLQGYPRATLPLKRAAEQSSDSMRRSWSFIVTRSVRPSVPGRVRL